MNTVKRMAESRRRLRQIADIAHGVYLENEENKADSWRDLSRATILARMILAIDVIVENQGKIKSVLTLLNYVEMYGAKVVEKENGSI